MKLYICSVLDKKVNAFMMPQFFRTKGEAIRSFMDAVTSEGAPFKKHAEDYVFCFLGIFDDGEGRFENVAQVPEILMHALDALVVEGNVN